MNNYNMLQGIYGDFFGKSNNEEKVIEIKDENINVDDLFITEDSKNLLKKIITYMEKYDLKEESNYINFNIVLETNDTGLIDDITKILKYYANKYHYIDKSYISDVSIYNLDIEEAINDYYREFGIIILKDLSALNFENTEFKNKFIFNLKEQLTKKKITIICGKKDEINSFLLCDSNLESNHFNFRIQTTNPSINDVYNKIIKEKDLDEQLNIKVLDYITNTYPKTSLNYTTYVNNLSNYISFNKDVPKLEEIKSIEEIFKDLNELVGLKKVKNTLNDLVNLISLKSKTNDEIKINNVNLHMVFLGNPGTGKTTVARLICEILYNLKYVKQNKLIEVSSKDLIAEYVGQTAVKTMDVVNKAMGGVLFIDEAYSLATTTNSNSYNGECIATLIKAMEDYRDNLVVIFAGYTKEMQDFLNSNSGIVSRIGYTLEFDDYTNDELKQIFVNMIKKAGFNLEDDALIEVDNLIEQNRNTRNFGNARFIRNVYEKTVINHASNTKNTKNKKALKLITKKDICY